MKSLLKAFVLVFSLTTLCPVHAENWWDKTKQTFHETVETVKDTSTRIKNWFMELFNKARTSMNR